MVSLELQAAGDSLAMYSGDVEHYKKQLEEREHNAALVALDRLFHNLSVNTKHYVDVRI